MSIVALSPGLLRSDPIEITRRPDGSYRGQWSRPWLEYLQAEYQRIGGPSAPTNAELDMMTNTAPVLRPPEAPALFASAGWARPVLPEIEPLTFPTAHPSVLPQVPFPSPPVPPTSAMLLQNFQSMLALQESPGPLAALRAQTPLLEQDSFTITMTGFTTTVTGTARYVKWGPLVALFVPTMGATSNATTCTLTGLPAGITPADVSYGSFGGQDNSVAGQRTYRLNISTTIDLFPTFALGLWTAAGVKALGALWIVYGV